MGFGVGGHGEAVNFDVVAGDFGLASEDTGALGGSAFEADYGVIGGVDPDFAIEEMGAFAQGGQVDDDALDAVLFYAAGLGVHFVIFGGDPRAFAVFGEVDVLFASEDSLDDGAAQEARAVLGDGGVLLAGGAVVHGLDGFFGGGIGVAVAVEGIVLLHGVTGDGVGAGLDGGVDALDDLEALLGNIARRAG